jgi:hypothetical protein
MSKKRGLTDHFPAGISASEMTTAEMRLTLAMIENGGSYNSIQRPVFQAFVPFYGWKNAHGTQTIAIVAIGHLGTFLLDMQEIECETADVWGAQIKTCTDYISTHGEEGTASIVKNASNVQRTVRNTQGMSSNCLVHSGNLLIQDTAKCFSLQFEQTKEVEC